MKRAVGLLFDYTGAAAGKVNDTGRRGGSRSTKKQQTRDQKKGETKPYTPRNMQQQQQNSFNG
jgi:hypothetical protein